METTQKIRAELDKLLEKTDDTEIIKAIGGIQAECSAVDKDYDELLKKHNALKSDYKEQVKKGVFSTREEETPHEEDKREPVSLESMANELLAKQEEK